MRSLTGRLLGTALTTLILFAAAHADIMFTPGKQISGNVQNVMVKHGTIPGTSIMGATNITGNTVLFTSTDVLTGTGGQSGVSAMSGLIHDITITLPGFTFSQILINPTGLAALGSLAVTATGSNGQVFNTTYGSSLHGNNFLTIAATGGEQIWSLTIDCTSGFQQLGQVRVSGLMAVPEPATLGLLGTGLIVLAGLARRKLKRTE